MDKGQSGQHYKRIKLRGIVQGVGFRPFVRRLAEKYGIRGSVRNLGGEVEVLACGADSLDTFILELLSPPFPARVDDYTKCDIPPFEAYGFIIDQSGQSQSLRLVPPDIAICPHCLSELEDARDRRAGYYFNTCTSCGPRYTIIESLPYDRENTSMRPYKMCVKCADEYTSLPDKRLKAETISCPDCGPSLFFTDGGEDLTGQQAFDRAVTILQNGGTVALKGLGGYHLACSPYLKNSADKLRIIKGRDTKPFAVMFPDIKAVKQRCNVLPQEKQLLRSPASPIVLLPVKDNAFTQSVLCSDLYCGCFLPYTPLHKLLLDRTSELVMTSANTSGQGIIADEKSIFSFLKKHRTLLSGVLYNDREIVRSAEDSVVRHISSGDVVIRRARGYVPEPYILRNPSGRDFLAAGGDLKSSFCLFSEDRAYISPYLGDLEDAGVYRKYIKTIKDYRSLFDITPNFVVCDKHPGYFSSDFARTLGLPVLEVGHHHAHIASVMAEDNIEEPVIGASFDGTGYGEDGALWGGEFLTCNGADYKRSAHLKYFTILGSDTSAIDASTTAACYLYAAGLDFTSTYGEGSQLLLAALESGIGTVRSSSMGRMFDAVSSLLGICSKNSYEGECAVLLQREAEKALRAGIKQRPLQFEIEKSPEGLIIGWEDIIRSAYTNKSAIGTFALGFHSALAKMTAQVMEMLRDESGINKAVLSGGVFQNTLLLEMCITKLKALDFEVHINKKSPPNDGGIALGQAYIASRSKKCASQSQ